MASKLDKIEAFLNSDAFLKETVSINADLDVLLDERDSEPFDHEWMDAFKEIDARFKLVQVDDFLNKKIQIIRELAFKRTYDLSGGDLSGYVSDDFELIAKAIVIGSENLWVGALFSSYLSGGVPSGVLERGQVNVGDLV